MAKRASVPQGKAFFFRSREIETADSQNHQTPSIAPVQEPDWAIAPDPIESPTQIVEPNGAHHESVATTKAARPPTRQSAIFLEERHIDWLEDRCREARRNGGRAIRKAAVIRALLDVAMESGIDLTGLRHEDDIHDRMRRALKSVD